MSKAASIAIVDDDRAIRAGLSSLIRSVGLDVELYESASDFIAAAASSPPDCLITDIQMPGISGLDLQKIVHETTPNLPVIVMTAYPDPAAREKALAAGAVAFLSKPFDAEELLRCVDQALEGR